jgi:hypothetical protein
MSWPRLRAAFALFAILGLAGSAAAQLALPTVERDAPDWDSDIDLAARYQKGTSIDAGGSFETFQYEVAGWAAGPFSEAIQVRLDASYTYTDYDFGPPAPGSCTGGTACFANDPWQGINRLDIAPGASFVLTSSIRLRLSVPVRWNAESGAEESGLTAGFVAQIQWRPSHRFTAGLGVGVQNELGADTELYPAISLDWRLGPEFRIRTRGGPYQGGELAAIWSPSDFFQGVLSAGYERQRFRLSRSGPEPDGIAEYTSIPLLVGLEFRFSSRFKVVAEGGMAVSGEMRLEDNQGQLIQKSDFDSAGLLRGYCSISF